MDSLLFIPPDNCEDFLFYNESVTSIVPVHLVVVETHGAEDSITLVCGPFGRNTLQSEIEEEMLLHRQILPDDLMLWTESEISVSFPKDLVEISP